MAETIAIDGEQWEIREEDTIWLGHGAQPYNRGCIVTAHNREALIKGIPGAREKHRMGAIAIGMEGAIVTAFKAVIKSNIVNAYKVHEQYAERQAKFAQLNAICADLWPWLFDVEAAAREQGAANADERVLR